VRPPDEDRRPWGGTGDHDGGQPNDSHATAAHGQIGSSEAESAVLGAALVSLTAARAVVERLAPEDYVDPRRRLVHSAIAQLVAENVQPDAVLALSLLRRLGLITSFTADMGAGPYLHTLIESCPVAASYGFYITIVLEASTRRRIEECAATLAQAAPRMPLADLERLAVDELAGVAAAIRRVRPTRAEAIAS